MLQLQTFVNKGLMDWTTADNLEKFVYIVAGLTPYTKNGVASLIWLKTVPSAGDQRQSSLIRLKTVTSAGINSIWLKQ